MTAAIFIANSQFFTRAHKEMVDRAINQFDNVIILVTASQECGTKEHPLNVATRMAMVQAIYRDEGKVSIYAISDHGKEWSQKWAISIIEHAYRYSEYDEKPLRIFIVKDEIEENFWNKLDIITKNFNITPCINDEKIEDLMVRCRRTKLEEELPSEVIKMYDAVRHELLSITHFYWKYKEFIGNEQ